MLPIVSRNVTKQFASPTCYHSTAVPSLQLLTESHYQKMPWKNGLGVTTEIAIAHPEEDSSSLPLSSLDRGNDNSTRIPFKWRVSRAQVSSDGPFSFFPNIDRCLIVLPGGGGGISMVSMEPNTTVEKKHCLLPLQPVYFSGDAETRAELLGGKSFEDFNVMSHREYIHSTSTSIYAVTAGGLHALDNHDHDRDKFSDVYDLKEIHQTKLPTFTLIYVVEGCLSRVTLSHFIGSNNSSSSNSSCDKESECLPKLALESSSSSSSSSSSVTSHSNIKAGETLFINYATCVKQDRINRSASDVSTSLNGGSSGVDGVDVDVGDNNGVVGSDINGTAVSKEQGLFNFEGGPSAIFIKVDIFEK